VNNCPAGPQTILAKVRRNSCVLSNVQHIENGIPADVSPIVGLIYALSKAPATSGYRASKGTSRGIQSKEGGLPNGDQGQAAQEVVEMGLTRDFKETVVARVERNPAFAQALLDEATTLLISGEAETARLILRDLVNATLGFEQLEKLTDVPSRSLHRMLSSKGNPSMDNLAAILSAVSSNIPRSRNTRQRKVA